jgi:hypothetical protein
MTSTASAPLCAKCRKAHRAYQAAYDRERYQARAAAGVCVRCGEGKPLKGRPLCAPCAANAAERTRRRRERERMKRRSPQATDTTNEAKEK